MSANAPRGTATSSLNVGTPTRRRLRSDRLGDAIAEVEQQRPLAGVGGDGGVDDPGTPCRASCELLRRIVVVGALDDDARAVGRRLDRRAATEVIGDERQRRPAG